MDLEVIENNVDSQANQIKLLFIHGAYHGAWCWEEKFFPYFAQKGCKCYAVSLRGHGKSEGREQIDDFSLDDYVDDVSKVIEQLKCAPILIGHSMGGAVAQKVASKAKNSISGMILLSSVPPKGMLLSFLKVLIKHTKTLKQLMNLNNAEEKFLVGKLFFSNAMDKKEKKIYCDKLVAESSLASRETVATIVNSNDIPSDLPKLIVGCKNDEMLSRGQMRKLAKSYHTNIIWMEKSGHDLMLDIEWKQVAKKIMKFVEKMDIK